MNLNQINGSIHYGKGISYLGGGEGMVGWAVAAQQN